MKSKSFMCIPNQDDLDRADPWRLLQDNDVMARDADPDAEKGLPSQIISKSCMFELRENDLEREESRCLLREDDFILHDSDSDVEKAVNEQGTRPNIRRVVKLLGGVCAIAAIAACIAFPFKSVANVGRDTSAYDAHGHYPYSGASMRGSSAAKTSRMEHFLELASETSSHGQRHAKTPTLTSTFSMKIKKFAFPLPYPCKDSKVVVPWKAQAVCVRWVGPVVWLPNEAQLKKLTSLEKMERWGFFLICFFVLMCSCAAITELMCRLTTYVVNQTKSRDYYVAGDEKKGGGANSGTKSDHVQRSTSQWERDEHESGEGGHNSLRLSDVIFAFFHGWFTALCVAIASAAPLLGHVNLNSGLNLEYYAGFVIFTVATHFACACYVCRAAYRTGRPAPKVYHHVLMSIVPGISGPLDSFRDPITAAVFLTHGSVVGTICAVLVGVGAFLPYFFIYPELQELHGLRREFWPIHSAFYERSIELPENFTGFRRTLKWFYLIKAEELSQPSKQTIGKYEELPQLVAGALFTVWTKQFSYVVLASSALALLKLSYMFGMRAQILANFANEGLPWVNVNERDVTTALDAEYACERETLRKTAMEVAANSCCTLGVRVAVMKHKILFKAYTDLDRPKLRSAFLQVDLLENTYAYKSSKTRVVALQEIEKLGVAAEPFMPTVAMMLSDEDDEVSTAAQEVISKLRDVAAPALPKLINLFTDLEAEKNVRTKALTCFISVGKDSEKYVKDLRTLLVDKADADLQKLALMYFHQRGELGKDFVSDMLRLFKRAETRDAAKTALTALSDAKVPVADQVVELLNDKEPDVRKKALDCLLGFGRASVPFATRMQELLQDPDVRMHALASLLRNRHAADSHGACIGEVSKILKDADASDQLEVLNTLSTLNNGDGDFNFGEHGISLTPSVVALLESSASFGGQTVGDSAQSTLKSLLGLVNHEGKAAQKVMKDAMPTVLKMLEATDVSVQQRALECIKSFGPKAADCAPKIVALLNVSDAEFRDKVLGTLQALHNASVPFVSKIAALLKDEAVRVRRAALQTLTSIMHFGAVDTAKLSEDMVAALLQETERATNKPTRQEAGEDIVQEILNSVLTLGKTGKSLVTPHMRHLLNHNSKHVRTSALRCIQKFGPDAAGFAVDVVSMLEIEDIEEELGTLTALLKDLGQMDERTAHTAGKLLKSERSLARQYAVCYLPYCKGGTAYASDVADLAQKERVGSALQQQCIESLVALGAMDEAVQQVERIKHNTSVFLKFVPLLGERGGKFLEDVAASLSRTNDYTAAMNCLSLHSEGALYAANVIKCLQDQFEKVQLFNRSYSFHQLDPLDTFTDFLLTLEKFITNLPSTAVMPFLESIGVFGEFLKCSMEVGYGHAVRNFALTCLPWLGDHGLELVPWCPHVLNALCKDGNMDTLSPSALKDSLRMCRRRANHKSIEETVVRLLEHSSPVVRKRMLRCLPELVLDDMKYNLKAILKDNMRAADHGMPPHHGGMPGGYGMPPQYGGIPGGYGRPGRNPVKSVREEAIEALCKLGQAAASVVPDILEMLTHSDHEVRMDAIQCLPRLGKGDAALAKQIADLLRDPQAEVRKSSLESLNQFEVEIASTFADRIAEMLEDHDDPVADTAVQSLCRLQDSAASATPLLKDLMRHNLVRVRKRALECLPHVGDSEAANDVAKLFNDTDVEICCAAVKAISKFDILPENILSAIVPLLAHSDKEICIAALDELPNLSRNVVSFSSELEGLLRSKHQDVRIAAAGCISGVDDVSATFAPSMLALLKEETSSFGFYVQEFFRKLGKTTGTIVSDVAELLMDKDYNLRQAALYCLNKGGKDSAIVASHVAKLLKDPIMGLRMSALQFLSEVGPARSQFANQIADLLNDGFEPVRLAALNALTEDCKRLSLRNIVPLLREPDESIRYTATLALSDLGEHLAPFKSEYIALLQDNSPRIRRAVLLALPDLGPVFSAFAQDVAVLLREVIASGNNSSTYMAPSLGTPPMYASPLPPSYSPPIGNSYYSPPIPSLTPSSLAYFDVDVGCAAMESLGKLGKAAAEFVPQVGALLKHVDSKVRKTALRSLSNFGDAAIGFAPEITALLRNFDEEIRLLALLALPKIGAKSSVKDVSMLLEDPDRHIRCAAAFSLSEFGVAASDFAPKIKDVLKEIPDVFCIAAGSSLGKLGMEKTQIASEVALLLQDSRPEIRESALRCLARLGEVPRDSVAGVVELLSHPNLNVNISALRCLRVVGGNIPVPMTALVALLRKRNVFVRYEALLLLSQIELDSSVAEAVREVATLLQHRELRVRTAALRCMVKIGPAAADFLPDVAKLLKSTLAIHRSLALQVLGKSGAAAAAFTSDVAALVDDDAEAAAEKNSAYKVDNSSLGGTKKGVPIQEYSGRRPTVGAKVKIIKDSRPTYSEYHGQVQTFQPVQIGQIGQIATITLDQGELVPLPFSLTSVSNNTYLGDYSKDDLLFCGDDDTILLLHDVLSEFGMPSEKYVYWGAVVQGVEIGDGTLDIGNGTFLNMAEKNVAVVVPVEKRPRVGDLAKECLSKMQRS